jgi:hypothetical protein
VRAGQIARNEEKETEHDGSETIIAKYAIANIECRMEGNELWAEEKAEEEKVIEK